MKFWLDLANSPHALFFGPIVRILRGAGHEVLTTSRRFGNTLEVARLMGFEPVVIGRHAGKGLIRKTLNLFSHAGQLARWARDKGFCLAFSHNSYSQAVAARLARVPFITFMDYEGQPANRIAFSLAKVVFVPEAFPAEIARRQGARRVIQYPGFKEEVYLADYSPGPSPYEEMGLGGDEVIVLARGPATYAAYGRENRVFLSVVEGLIARGARVVLLPRTPEEAEWGRARGALIPEKAYYGPDLVWHADLVVGAGGTITREAALLGVPSFTVFAGKLGRVDLNLIEMGLIFDLRDGDLSRVRLEKKPIAEPTRLNSALKNKLANLILEVVG
jgi:predicted glycosyltransferase